jgi:hypothetical protein
MSQKYKSIIEFVINNNGCSSTAIFNAFENKLSLATIKRSLQKLIIE